MLVKLSKAGLGLTLFFGSITAANALDSDRDGISNQNDRCPNSPLGSAVNTDGCHFQHAGALFTVTFSAGSAWVSAEQTLALRNVAKQFVTILSDFPEAKIAIRGFNGGENDRSTAEDLSLMRARNVMRQLKLSRIPAEAMQLEALGRAAVAGDKAAARRVDVLILAWPPAQARP